MTEERLVARYHVPEGIPARLMGVIDGWALVRRKGAMPFLIPEHEWVNATPCTPPASLTRPTVEGEKL